LNLDEVSKEIHKNATEKGFWDYMYQDNSPKADTFIFYAKQLAMIHSETTEVLEALRKDKGQDQVVEELADILIRVFDLYEGLRFNGDVSDSLHETLEKKMGVNKERPRMHGVAG
jgi:NTP pyrophosphatase (non-canonical NTP hydrolase)